MIQFHHELFTHVFINGIFKFFFFIFYEAFRNRSWRIYHKKYIFFVLNCGGFVNLREKLYYEFILRRMFFIFFQNVEHSERMKLVQIFLLLLFYREDCNSDNTATFTTLEFTYQHIPFIKKHPPLNAQYTICILKMSMVLPHRNRGSHLII